MFTSSTPVLFLDYFGIPYSVNQDGRESVSGGKVLEWLVPDGRPGRALCWPSSRLSGTRQIGLFHMENLHIAGCVLYDGGAVRHEHEGWESVAAVEDDHGRVIAAVRRSPEGVVYLPFDPAEVIRRYWSESYSKLIENGSSRAKHLGRRAYYVVRPGLPRNTQLWVRRRYRGVQSRVGFPRWPVEPCLHDFYGWFADLLVDLAGCPVPSIAPWPRRRRWALVLTHDVETGDGCDRIPALRGIEESLGLRSAWYFVPKRYTVPGETIRSLIAGGFEVGVHGLYHDGHDMEPNVLPRRSTEIRRHGEEWGARGFRAPSMLRYAEGIRGLDFDYDSSYPDTDPFQPQAGGCCTWLPFLNGDVVELPVTLAQDHTLFEILEERDEAVWVEKTDYLRSRSGAAVLITHPDYMTVERLRIYERFLRRFRDDSDVWHVLPAEVSAWWRRRVASRIEGGPGDWHVVGPAADEAEIEVLT